MKIVTHGGQAHMDDLLAAAFLIAKCAPDEVHRRDPTEQELDNPAVTVFDVGGRHDGDNNYDHHQLDRDAPATCALSLVLKAYGEYNDWKALYPWIEGIEVMDSKGPFEVSRRLGLNWDELAPYATSPVTGFMLDMFASQEVHREGEECYNLLWKFGRSLIAKVKEIKDLWRKFDKEADFHSVDAAAVIVIPTTGAKGVESWIKRGGYTADCTIINDDRGEGLAVFRRNDSPLLDFSRCEGMSNVLFAHKGGFVAKTTDHDWLPVVKQAITV